MKEIGGYFELELNRGSEYHNSAISLNLGRTAFEYLLRSKKIHKVFLPFYTCDVMLEPVKKTGTVYEYYHIDNYLEPVFDYTLLRSTDYFLYTNYFGLKDKFIEELAKKVPNLIIDNSQAFFAKPITRVDTFYSPRKFFGVPDGGYLYMEGVSDLEFPQDSSLERFKHLLKRVEFGAEVGYEDFKANDISFINNPIMRMSKLTKALLCNIDYEFAKRKRVENFLFLHDHLSKSNELQIKLVGESVPMVYPFLTNKYNIKRELLKNKIYVATYWPNVIKNNKKGEVEYYLAERIVCLPIDHRYGIEEMKEIIKKLK